MIHTGNALERAEVDSQICNTMILKTNYQSNVSHKNSIRRKARSLHANVMNHCVLQKSKEKLLWEAPAVSASSFTTYSPETVAHSQYLKIRHYTLPALSQNILSICILSLFSVIHKQKQTCAADLENHVLQSNCLTYVWQLLCCFHIDFLLSYIWRAGKLSMDSRFFDILSSAYHHQTHSC